MYENILQQLKSDYPGTDWVTVSESKHCVYMLSNTGVFVSVGQNGYKVKRPYSDKHGILFVSYQDEATKRSRNRSLSKLLKTYFSADSNGQPEQEIYCENANAEDLLRKNYPDENFAVIGNSEHIKYMVSDKGKVFAVLLNRYKEIKPWYRNKLPYITLYIDKKPHNYSLNAVLLRAFNQGIDQVSELEGEIWKPLPLDADYAVSNLGRVKSKKRGAAKLIRGRSIINGHAYVNLRIGGEQKLIAVNRLVADVFIDDPEHCKYVYNKDGDLRNCCADNLQKVSSTNHAVNMGRKSSRIKSIRIRCIETGKEYSSLSEAAADLNIPVQHISLAIRWNATIDNKYTFEVLQGALKKCCNPVKIRCEETGEVYSSVDAAAKSMELRPKAIIYAMRHKTKVDNKYTFIEVK